LLGTVVGVSLPLFVSLSQLLVISLLASLAMIMGELFMKHGADEAIRAGTLLARGPLAKPFWLCAIGCGIVVPVVLVLWPANSLIPNIVAAALVLFGLWYYEHLWVKAGQALPLS